MSRKKLTTGNVVNVYQKPFSDDDFEGPAKLIQLVDNEFSEGYDGLERWLVDFKDEDGGQHERLVHARNIVKQ